eukprot:TRINITY_DN95_c0_g2_i2.p2 TRINITY_DN95_c0_g2~~TRINITY_DN95_c0_g2_i2.p2  ORF type:complete len:139 (+),score=41.33 TRINITY_DN95_c0_g2_i2:48-419(+)
MCIRDSNNAIAVSEFDDPATGEAAYSSIQTLASFVLFLASVWLSEQHPAWLLSMLIVNLFGAYFTSFKLAFKSEAAKPTENLAIEPQKEVSAPSPSPQLPEQKPEEAQILLEQSLLNLSLIHI